MSDEVRKECSLTRTDVKAVLMALAEKLAEHLGEGRKVSLDGIGYFQVNLHCREEVLTPRGARQGSVGLKSVSFRAGSVLKQKIKEQAVVRSRAKAHSAPLGAEEVDARLAGHFAARPAISRKEFQALCGMLPATACRTLKRLVAEGRLRNIGTRHSPLYVPGDGQAAASDALAQKNREGFVG